MILSKYRTALPQLGSRLFLTDGGLETTLIFHNGLELPHFASFTLLRAPEGRKTLGDYFIYEIDKNPVACVALHVYPEANQGELACLCVSSSHENQGIGRKLIQFVEGRARESGLRELLALSTQAFTYFQSKGGFVEGTPDDLPPPRREKYEQGGRRSKVLLKTLG